MFAYTSNSEQRELNFNIIRVYIVSLIKASLPELVSYVCCLLRLESEAVGEYLMVRRGPRVPSAVMITMFSRYWSYTIISSGSLGVYSTLVKSLKKKYFTSSLITKNSTRIRQGRRKKYTSLFLATMRIHWSQCTVQCISTSSLPLNV